MSSELDKLLLISIKVVLALVFLTSLIVMADPLPDTFFPFIVGKALYFRTLTEIALGLWLVLVFRYPSHLPPRSWLYIAFAVYVAIAFAAAMFGVSPQRSLWSTYERMQGVVDLAHWFAFTVVFTSIFRSWADWRWILHARGCRGWSILRTGSRSRLCSRPSSGRGPTGGGYCTPISP